jgi:hypothetical protein
MTVGRIKEIRRYPVKSMGGERLDRVEVDTNGLYGDRAWAVRDEVRGGIRGGKKIPALMQCRARYPTPPARGLTPPAEITLPDGSVIISTAADASTRLSEALAHPVTLWPLLPAEALDHYRRGAPTHRDVDEELRSIFARTADEPLPDLSVFPPELFEFESPPGTYFDAFPLLLMTDASLARLQSRAGDSIIDVRRFRPNLLVKVIPAGEDFVEMGWRGRRLRAGSLVVEVTIACPRCVMITHGFDDLARDPRIMRLVVREAGGNAGVYATVAVPGTVAVGDPVELL